MIKIFLTYFYARQEQNRQKKQMMEKKQKSFYLIPIIKNLIT